MKFDPSVIAGAVKEELRHFSLAARVDEAGRVSQVGDGIARVAGLGGAMSGELLRFETGVLGIAMNLEEDNIAVVLLGKDSGINVGDFVSRTGKVAHVPVGDMLLGRVVNSLGEQMDQKGEIPRLMTRPVERIAPGVLSRKPVSVPLLTGIKAIDAMVPIGRGQRQLIVGDRQTGKTSLAIDVIINQKGQNVNCVYVAIGQKNSTVASVVSALTEHDALRYTVIVVAGASDAASLQYLAPYSGCAIAEHWMDRGKDVLIVYDDLSKHAVAYRTLSLLMRRPPGREAFPGDVFYLHSRLLERSGRLNDAYGGGSMTALPIIETQAGNMSAYIPTNTISITDGQIYLETESFNAGIRPAINPGLSVSRVGGAAQTKAMKSIAAPLRTELAQYRELRSFAQFSSDLDDDTRARLNHGERIVEALKQKQYRPMPLEHEILALFALTRGCLRDIHVEDVLDFQEGLTSFFSIWHANTLAKLQSESGISPELEAELLSGIDRYKAEFLTGKEKLKAEDEDI